MNLVNSIVLSTGKVIKIPIFSDFNSENIIVQTRSGGVIRDYIGSSLGGSLYYSLLNDDELCELASIISGNNYSEYTDITPFNVGHKIINLAWIKYNDEYILSTGMSYGSNNFILVGLLCAGSVGSRYYNSKNINNDISNPQPENKYEDFYDFISSDLLTSSSVGVNVREGSYYSIDLAASMGGNPYSIIGSGSYFTLDRLLLNFNKYAAEHPDSTGGYTTYDTDSNDPYINDNTVSGFGGGDGDINQDLDLVEKAVIPPLPTLSAVSTGLITLYNCTIGQLAALGAYLWSDIFDIDTNFKKLFSNPMDCIIGLGIVPVQPALGGATNVKFGNINTNVSMSKISSQYIELDCGTINLKEFIGSFLDYSPYVKISIYLPYIGFRDLSADDVMNDTIHVVYHVDVLTGGCCAMIETGKKGLLYSFNGSCITNVPITAINYSGAIQNAVSAIGAGATTIAGIATGAAPLTAMGATQLLSAGANTALNSKPTVTRSGSMGGSAGLMSYQKPYIVINRPRMSVPDQLNKFIGNTLNVTMKLSTLKGFTQVELIHLDNIPCTDNERSELLALLKEGVIF